MRILVGGAGGAVGRQLVPLLAASGHRVIAVSPAPTRFCACASKAVQGVVADPFDPCAVKRLVRDVFPDVVINLVAAPSPVIGVKRRPREPSLINRLRIEGTSNLMEAAEEIPGVYVMSESLAYLYDRPQGSAAIHIDPADEATPFWPHPPGELACTVAAVRYLENRTAQSGGAVLRLGHLYGPATVYAADGAFTHRVRIGKAPVVGGGRAIFSFIHTLDAAMAFSSALNRRASGIFNIVDDEPAPTSRWLPFFAEVLGAWAPKDRLTAVEWLVSGGSGVVYTTRLRGAANERARLRLDWSLQYPSWRLGFRALKGATSSDIDGSCPHTFPVCIAPKPCEDCLPPETASFGRLRRH